MFVVYIFIYTYIFLMYKHYLLLLHTTICLYVFRASPSSLDNTLCALPWGALLSLISPFLFSVWSYSFPRLCPIHMRQTPCLLNLSLLSSWFTCHADEALWMYLQILPETQFSTLDIFTFLTMNRVPRKGVLYASSKVEL